MSLISFLLGKRLNALELMLLAKLQEVLPAKSAGILKQQINAIDHVNRMAGYREVLCYRKGRMQQSSLDSQAPTFAANQAELKFATIHFSNSAGQKWTVDFFLVKGTLFSIVFTPSANQIRHLNDLQIEKVQILKDLSKAAPERPDETRPISRTAVKLPAWMEQLELEYQTRGFFEPLSNNLQQAHLREITAVMPEEYLHLVEATEGLIIGHVSILGLSQVYEIVMKDWNYYVLAEIHSAGVLAVKAHSKDSELYFLDYEGFTNRDMGKNLSDAIKSLNH